MSEDTWITVDGGMLTITSNQLRLRTTPPDSSVETVPVSDAVTLEMTQHGGTHLRRLLAVGGAYLMICLGYALLTPISGLTDTQAAGTLLLVWLLGYVALAAPDNMYYSEPTVEMTFTNTETGDSLTAEVRMTEAVHVQFEVIEAVHGHITAPATDNGNSEFDASPS